MVAPNAQFDLTQEHADAINALLSTCKYVVGIRKNETGEVRFCPQKHEWGEHSLWWWSGGNGSCDCNKELIFRRQTEDVKLDEVKCSDDRYTVVGIWLPDGGHIRDLNYLNDF